MEIPAEGKLENESVGQWTFGLITIIQKEITMNEGSIVWTDRKARLLRCIAQKKVSCPRGGKKENA